MRMLRNRTMPQATVIPELAYPDPGAAADWLCAAFGFTIRLRIQNHRIQLNVPPDGNLVVTELGEHKTGADHMTMIRVDDVDAHHARAVANGARIVAPPADYPYGERQYSAIDPGGHTWSFSQSIADVDPRSFGAEPGKL